MDVCPTFCYVEAHRLGPGAVPGQGGGPHPGRVVPRGQVGQAGPAVLLVHLTGHALQLLRLRHTHTHTHH